MKKILTVIGIAALFAGSLLVPSVTHAQYYSYGSPYMNLYPNYSYSYNYSYAYQYPSNGYTYYTSTPENYYYPNDYYDTYGYNNNYGYNYNSGYNYNNNYYYQQPTYTVTHICGPNSTYDPAGNDCDCYQGYISQNNICVPQAVTYGYNYNSYPTYLNGYIKPVAICNDGTASYSPVGTCWLNGGVRSWYS